MCWPCILTCLLMTAEVDTVTEVGVRCGDAPFSHLLWTLVFPDCRFNLSEYYVGEHDKDYICSQLYEHGSDQPHRRRRSNRSIVFTDSLLANWSGLKIGPRLVISRVSCGYKYTVRLR